MDARRSLVPVGYVADIDLKVFGEFGSTKQVPGITAAKQGLSVVGRSCSADMPQESCLWRGSVYGNLLRRVALRIRDQNDH